MGVIIQFLEEIKTTKFLSTGSNLVNSLSGLVLYTTLEFLRTLDLKQRIEEDPISLVPNGYYIVADSANKLKTFMMTPYKDTGSLTKNHHTNNLLPAMLSSAPFGC